MISNETAIALTRAPTYWGLLAAGPVKWLLFKEPDVHAKVQDFIEGRMVGNMIDVSGPPSAEDQRRLRFDPLAPVMLPMIRLRLERVKHHLTGQPGVKVECSDAHMDEIERWMRQAGAISQRPALARR